jgi:hypothetical protein
MLSWRDFSIPIQIALSWWLQAIARGGTVAAGEFLVDAYRMDGLARPVPKDWSHKNVEIFLETQVIDGRSGPPRIDESTPWQPLPQNFLCSSQRHQPPP